MKGFRARAESQISRGLPSCVLSQRPSEIKNLARKSSRLHVGFSESFRRNQNRHSSPISATQEVFQVAGIIEVGRGILGLGTGVGILAALTWSGLPVISASNKQKEQRNNVDDEDAIGVKWGVMTLLSFLPLFNWLVCLLCRTVHCLFSCLHLLGRSASLLGYISGIHVGFHIRSYGLLPDFHMLFLDPDSCSRT